MLVDHLLAILLVLAWAATLIMIGAGLFLFVNAIWSLARDWRSSRMPKPKPCIYGIPPYSIEVHWLGTDELRVNFYPRALVEDLLGRRSFQAALTGAVVALYPEGQRPYAIGPSEHVVSLTHHWLFVGTAHRLPQGLEPEYIWEASRPGVCTHGSATEDKETPDVQ